MPGKVEFEVTWLDCKTKVVPHEPNYNWQVKVWGVVTTMALAEGSIPALPWELWFLPQDFFLSQDKPKKVRESKNILHKF